MFAFMRLFQSKQQMLFEDVEFFEEEEESACGWSFEEVFDSASCWDIVPMAEAQNVPRFPNKWEPWFLVEHMDDPWKSFWLVSADLPYTMMNEPGMASPVVFAVDGQMAPTTTHGFQSWSVDRRFKRLSPQPLRVL